MNEYFIDSKYRCIVIQRKKFVNSDNKSFTIEMHYNSVNIVIKCNEDPIIDFGECMLGENLTKYLDDKYPNYEYYFDYSCDGVISRDAPEDVKHYLNNLPNVFYSDFRDDSHYEMLDCALEEYGWTYNKKNDELWVFDYTPEITGRVYAKQKEKQPPVELHIVAETEPLEPLEEVQWEDVMKC